MVPKEDPDPKAVACYGIVVRVHPRPGAPAQEQMWVRFAEPRPVSRHTTAFLSWSCEKLEAMGKTALLLIWDNAPWHVSREVRGWIREHNLQVKGTGKGVRIVRCQLPIKSPWLNPIEPRWIHAKRSILEPERLLSGAETSQRVCDHFGQPLEPPLSDPKEVA